MTREQRLVLAIAVLASFVSFLDGTVVTVALAHIREELGGGLAAQQWIVDAYLITLGALILVAGSISDVYGRIRVLWVGLIVFGVTSVAIAAAPTVEFLIVARALQGVGGALLVPSSLALITSTFSGAAQSRAIGLWTGLTTVAMIAGPVIGGVFVDLLSWRLVFLINVIPIAVVFVLLVRLHRRDERTPEANVDVLGAVLGTLGLAGIVFALIEQPNLGWGSPLILVTAIGGAAAFIGFLVHQFRAKQPMMPPSLFRVRDFAWGNLATTFIYAALSLSSFLIGVYLQQGLGVAATLAGLASLPSTIIMIALSSRVGALAGRWGSRWFMTAGPILAAGGTLLYLLITPDFHFGRDYWLQLLPGVLVFGIGLTLTVSPLTSAVLGAIEPGRSGIASAVNNAIARVAGLVAIALLSVIVGGQLDFDGFRRGVIVSAVLLALGGVVSAIGIRDRKPAAVE
ncbi:DHA2 family efflux MFS transporter permease subunit [Schumannella sp. 10F1B-5-1]|uniref:DHA2 family efflux MFS transporter permease subunit n=1 Tax=Schumannella sp. 10F1B-5-1 TaxID=2590780 RepID=UPI001131818F|nr:DHA2 family efflux MFS transporter permease subunit [Schumannella sp. 10F1B-5-1]TPW70188.1 DHA2 family efflux MFS transporter permease subunit [Schumannella sp. 10F1B-5-1]